MSFPSDVKEQALVASGRHCSLCHKFCGLKIELHHVIQEAEGGTDTFDNCIPLCFECHGDMRSYDHKHPKGIKYTPNELRKHRDLWYAKVSGSPAPQYTEQSAKLDSAVFLWLKQVLPWNGSVRFARVNNFAGFSFALAKLDDFYKFLNQCEDPSREFLDADLEGLRGQLIADIIAFVEVIGTNTFPVERRTDRNSVPAEWEYEQPERFDRVVGELQSRGNKIADCYSTIVRECRRRLGVE
jgi:hypothetical protein